MKNIVNRVLRDLKKDASEARKSELGEELTSKENEVNVRYFSKNRFNPGKNYILYKGKKYYSKQL